MGKIKSLFNRFMFNYRHVFSDNLGILWFVLTTLHFAKASSRYAIKCILFVNGFESLVLILVYLHVFSRSYDIKKLLTHRMMRFTSFVNSYL